MCDVSLIFDASSRPIFSATLSTTSSYVCCFDLHNSTPLIYFCTSDTLFEGIAETQKKTRLNLSDCSLVRYIPRGKQFCGCPRTGKMKRLDIAQNGKLISTTLKSQPDLETYNSKKNSSSLGFSRRRKCTTFTRYHPQIHDKNKFSNSTTLSMDDRSW